MNFVSKEVPKIAGAALVTDGEENIIRAITECLPQVRHLCCWNHIMQSGARHWLTKQIANAVSTYKISNNSPLHQMNKNTGNCMTV